MSSDDPAALPTARLFYALWPDAALRQELLAHQRSWQWPAGAALTRPERLHMTLHFLGEVPRSLLPALLDALPALPEPLEIQLSQAALWRGGLAVLLAPTPPPALLSLHLSLATSLQGLGLPTESRPYAAHVTLARRVPRAQAPQAFAPILWRVREAVLVETVRPQGDYRLLGNTAT